MQFIRMILALMLLAVLISYPYYSHDNQDMSRDARVTKLLASLSSPDGPGIQYVVVGKAGVLYGHCLGLADVENKAPLSLSHSMAAFSMTKSLTAIAMLGSSL